MSMKLSSSLLVPCVLAMFSASSCASAGTDGVSTEATSSSTLEAALEPTSSEPTSSIVETTAPTATVGTDASVASALEEESTGTPPTVPADIGDEVGYGAIGPAFGVRQPWPVGTIYTDLEPGAIVVDFNPPEIGCIAAEVTATVGRGGAILVDLFVDAEREPGAQCSDGAIGNNITVAMPQETIDRGFYTTTSAATGGESAEAEAVADAVIGLSLDEASALIAAGGFLIRDLTDATSVEEDFNPGRINVRTADGFVTFAAVY